MATKKKVRLAVAVVLSLLTAAFTAWIFSNSLQVATESAAQSDSFTQKIQKFFQVFAPNSAIATATGDAFDALENGVRVLAHFAEFALLGALAFWTYRAYTDEKIWMITPFACVAAVPMIDESLQYFTPGRAFEFTDVLIDCAGAWTGCLFAWGTLLVGIFLYQKIKFAVHNKRRK